MAGHCRAKEGVFSIRARALHGKRPEIVLIIEPFLNVRENIRQLVREIPLTRSLMTVPGVGPVTSLAF